MQFRKLQIGGINTIKIQHSWSLFFAVLLVFLNHYLEYQKWLLVMQTTNETFNKKTKVQSYFAGIITGMLTPNMQGNFIGRIYYFKRKFRLNLTLLTLISNLGQFCVTISMGLIAFAISGYSELPKILTLLLLCSVCWTLYAFFTQLNFLKKHFKWFQKLAHILKSFPYFRLQIIALSLLRHLVFSLQLLLILYTFGGTFDSYTFLLICQLYLWTSISPSLIFGKIFVRESIALWVFASLSLSEWNIIASTFVIWVINLLIPTLIALYFCKKRTV